MSTTVTNLKVRFGVDTADLRRGFKEGEQALTSFKGGAGDTLNQFASMFGVNMSAVNGVIGTAQKSLGFLGQSFRAAAVGGDVLTISMKVLKWALVSTGLGAIVVALGSLMAYFMKTGDGTDRFAKIMMQLRSVLDNVIDRLAIFGKGLWEIMTGKFKQGWEDMSTAFKGMGTEIKEDWQVAGKLADGLDALEDREIALISTLEERKAKAAELRQLAKEEGTEARKKLDMLEQAEKLYKSVYGDQISLEKERLALMKEQLAVQTSDPTDEQRRTVAEQEAKISSLYREQAEQLKGLNREKKASLALVAEEVALEQKKTDSLKNPIKTADISDLKMPDFNQLSNSLQKVVDSAKKVKAVMLDMSSAISAAIGQAFVAFGEYLGKLATGNAKLSDFGSFIAQTIGDLCVTVGTAAIMLGSTMLAAKMSFANPLIAIAAGVALVAFGTMVKGALGKIGGGGAETGVSQSNNYTYDNTGSSKSQPATQSIHITGKLTASGQDLVYVFNQEGLRRNAVT